MWDGCGRTLRRVVAMRALPMTAGARFVTFIGTAGGQLGYRWVSARPMVAVSGLGNFTLMHACRRPLATVVAFASLIVGSVVVSEPSAAQESPSAERDQIGDQQALVSLDVDVLRADNVAVGDTLASVRENVAAQQQMLADAQTTLTTAQTALATAEAALLDTQARIDAVNLNADLVVVDAFVNPPVESSLDALTADNLVDATVKQSILHRQADTDAATLGEFQVLQEQLEAEQAEREAAAEAAAEAEAEAAEPTLEDADAVAAN